MGIFASVQRVGETYAHAIIKDSMLKVVTQKQYRGSLVRNGLNANALNSQEHGYG